MFICSGGQKTPVRLTNFGPLSHGKEWLLQKCQAIQRKHVKVYLEYQPNVYFPILHEENLFMAVEMAYTYYESSLDPRDFPEWMNNMDNAWYNYCSDDDVWDDSESSSEEYSDSWDY